MDESLMQELAQGQQQTPNNEDNRGSSHEVEGQNSSFSPLFTEPHTRRRDETTGVQGNQEEEISPLTSSSGHESGETHEEVQQSPLHTDEEVDMDHAAHSGYNRGPGHRRPVYDTSAEARTGRRQRQPQQREGRGEKNEEETWQQQLHQMRNQHNRRNRTPPPANKSKNRLKMMLPSRGRSHTAHHPLRTEDDDEDVASGNDIGDGTLGDDGESVASGGFPGSPDVWEEIRQNATGRHEVVDVGRKAMDTFKRWAGRFKPLRKSRHNPDKDKIGSGFVPNSNEDYFYATLYWYFDEKGFVTIVTSRILNLFTLTFILMLSAFLLAFVDWDSLMECHDEESCKQFSEYVRSPGKIHSKAWLSVVALYSAIFGVYWLWSFLSIFPTTWAAWGMHLFYQRHLDISDNELQTMEWHQVIDSWDRLLCVARLLSEEKKRNDLKASTDQENYNDKSLRPLLRNLQGTDVNNLGDDAAAIMELASSVGLQLHYVNTGVDFGLPVPSEWLLRPTVNPWASFLYADKDQPQQPRQSPPTNQNVDIRFVDYESEDERESQLLTDNREKPLQESRASDDDKNAETGQVPLHPPQVQREKGFSDKNETEEGQAPHPTGKDNNNQELLTAHYIACRLMRRDNYLIAMFNERILDTRIPFPLPSLVSDHSWLKQ
eukprot:gb/GECG01014825.1/.p1 GENE.gb/GECG01014825.1/~~gb/GECG01014825.1/.p1  ORF type:complete len:660 (+),score=91.79 gb/GECG01014825.1/:1-1980(+)